MSTYRHVGRRSGHRRCDSRVRWLIQPNLGYPTTWPRVSAPGIGRPASSRSPREDRPRM